MTLAFDVEPDARHDPSLRRLWIVLGLIGAGAMTAVAARATVVRFAPRTAAAFEAAGLPVTLSGLALDRVSARIVADGERRILVVAGDVVNASDRDEAAKPLSVTVRGDQGEVLYSWITRAPQQKVAAGERAAFVARLASPPANAVDTLVEFDRAATIDGRTRESGARTRLQGSRTESQ